MREIYFQVSYPPEINIGVRHIDVIILRIACNVFLNQFHKVISGAA
jgi:hypothetical protein